MLAALETPPSILRHLPLALLIAANIVPVAGVLLWGWNVFEIVSLYWFENVVIGIFNALKMLTATSKIQPASQPAGSPGEDPEMPAYLKTPVATGIAGHGIKLFLIPFFTVHYGMFCFVHGIFVVVLLGGRGGGMMKGDPFSGAGTMTARVFDSGGKWFILAIVGSHLFSFLFNYLGKGEYRHISAPPRWPRHTVASSSSTSQSSSELSSSPRWAVRSSCCFSSSSGKSPLM